MSGQHHTTSQDEPHYYYTSHDPHTAIPDWAPLCTQLSVEARLLIIATTVLQKARQPPTRRQLAHALRVDERSIYRWLEEIAAAGALSTRRAGRRQLIVFRQPTTDQAITDRTISDQAITDRTIRYTRSSVEPRTALERHKPAIPDQAISDPSGGGGDPCSIELDSPPTTTAPRKISPSEITTDTGRWMVAQGFSLTKAYQHQLLPLAPTQADFQRRRQLGQQHGAIALAWDVAPPAGESSAPTLAQVSGEFTFSENEKQHYRAMGFAIGDEQQENIEP